MWSGNLYILIHLFIPDLNVSLGHLNGHWIYQVAYKQIKLLSKSSVIVSFYVIASTWFTCF
jgi:hypothetical protein